jgi:2-(1,2-epoxy-1,2-dihydrophenyl)acetyl-CoA isomerase
MDAYKTLLVEDRGPVRLITLNQPAIFNPLDEVSGPELVAALEAADLDQAVRALVLTGAGKAFSAGGNVRMMGEQLQRGQATVPFFAAIGGVLNRSIIALRRMGKPVVCALNGVAAGGGLGWCLACDLVVAAQSARLDPGYIRIGLNPDGGATAIITSLIGHKRATEFFMLGQALEAQTALAWGLVNRVVEDAAVLEEALKLAGQLAQGPRRAMAATKDLLNRAIFGGLENILENERGYLLQLADRPDFVEGIKAFFERRKPSFGG